MKKIKKLKKLELNSNEMSKIRGGCEYDNCGSAFQLDMTSPPPYEPDPDPDPTHCACGCNGCSYEDGGPGFNIGMNFNNLDGYDCTWYSIM